MPKIIHIITGLGVGGAEQALLNLLSQLNGNRYKHQVISLGPIGPIGRKIQQKNIPVIGLCVNKINVFWKFFNLIKILKKEKPNIVHMWMYHANLFGGIATKVSGITNNVIWSIHHTYSKNTNNFKIRILTNFCRFLSFGFPKYIVMCGYRSAESHVQLGYDASKIVVIPNGVDSHKFFPRISKKVISGKNILRIGTLGRYVTEKDYPNLLKAARLVSQKERETNFFLAGKDLTKSNKALIKFIRSLGLENRIKLLGLIENPEAYLRGLDIFILSSLTEGFPNVLIEAMSSGLFCIATDVGDCRRILGNTGIIIPPRDEIALSKAMLKALNLSQEKRKEYGILARKRVKGYFDIQIVASKYEELYNKIQR